MNIRNCMRLVALAVPLLVAAGCDVTVEPKSTVAETNAFTDTSSYKAFLAKLYAGLALTGQRGQFGDPDIKGIDEGFSQYLRLLWQMQELPTDEAVIAWNDAGVQELNTQLWSSSNQFLVAMYYRIFFQVAQANEFLRQTTDDKLTERGVSAELRANITTYRAEARFLRALSYWHAIDLFGNIPLVKEDFPVGTTPPPQATRADIFAFVESELRAILPDLPPADIPADGSSRYYGRATQEAAQMLLAKLYQNAIVYTGQDRAADALAAAQAVIASGKFQLDPDYGRIFQADNNTSPEIIFAVPQDGEHTQSFGGTTFLVHAAVGGTMDAADFGIDFAWFGLRARPELVTTFDTTSSDVRADSVFYTNGQNLHIGDLTNFTDGYGAPKYQNVTSSGVPGSDVTFVDTDYPMFRLADAYLIYAEEVLRGGGGDRATALAYINAIRQRAYGNTSGDITDADLTLDFILRERARELFWEGHRRTDLIRFGLFTDQGVWEWKGGVQTGRTTESFRNLYPLPASELLANPNLQQNPGY